MDRYRAAKASLKALLLEPRHRLTMLTLPHDSPTLGRGGQESSLSTFNQHVARTELSTSRSPWDPGYRIHRGCTGC